MKNNPTLLCRRLGDAAGHKSRGLDAMVDISVNSGG